ncbi:MAG: DUF423 domain-containing protein [Paenibacillus macerans]|uniref:DUF423 domain-containing protein n=1 Tax=Paenibacillus macerans TaxID=44252 RepID=A0A090ZGT2_PAEMA|nr:DUF423 domain-containing protein [Paenibacillus macerans]KFN09568.1 hypothetical protein DJ90_3241 [Paenibacillus macerans]MBS5912293.1 DUF423 domain-containing protein [Paenibacillus macerans]MCY7557886.1 DUF423 domain-containing protein [Paenibacillus macerans]MDU5946441.1 DUF423 domain-containing protein [Paenibacillus macerans]MDU7476025.1 DUF423 domain-containing protein [Paenibacillus macerans]
MQTLLALGGIMMFIAVALGAFGAHALKKILTGEQQKTYQTGVQYHIAHGLGLVLLGLAAAQSAHASQIVLAGWFLLAGIVLFSGSLYALSLTGIRKLGAITPLGGVCFLIGWAIFAVAAIQG